jgi:hypothetical protein
MGDPLPPQPEITRPLSNVILNIVDLAQLGDSLPDTRRPLARDSQNPDILKELAVQRSLNCRTPVNGDRTPIPALEIFDDREQESFPQVEDYVEDDEEGRREAYFDAETKEDYRKREIKEEAMNDVKPEVKSANELHIQRRTLPLEWVRLLFSSAL